MYQPIYVLIIQSGGKTQENVCRNFHSVKSVWLNKGGQWGSARTKTGLNSNVLILLFFCSPLEKVRINCMKLTFISSVQFICGQFEISFTFYVPNQLFAFNCNNLSKAHSRRNLICLLFLSSISF